MFRALHCNILLRDLESKKIRAEVFEESPNELLEKNFKVKWSEKVANEDVLQRIGEKRTLLNDTERKKTKRIVDSLT